MFATSASLYLSIDRARDLITGQQLWGTTIVILILIPAIGLCLIICILIFEYLWDVIEHEALTIRVGENSTLTADGFGY